MKRRVLSAWLCVTLIAVDARPARAASPAPPTAVETLAKLEQSYATQFNWGIAYWLFGAGLVVTAAAVLAPVNQTESGRLSLVSGTATFFSGVSSSVSGAPLFLAPGHLASLVRANGGASSTKDEVVARRILERHAAWATQWRWVTLVVTTTLLAVNCGVLSAFAAKNTYQRTSVAVVAGLYGLGVAVVPWYDSLPWPEEKMAAALKNGSPATPSTSLYLRPAVMEAQQGYAFSLALGGSW